MFVPLSPQPGVCISVYVHVCRMWGLGVKAIPAALMRPCVPQ